MQLSKETAIFINTKQVAFIKSEENWKLTVFLYLIQVIMYIILTE